MNGHLEVKRTEWNEQSALWLSKACDEHYPLEVLEEDIRKGEGALFDVFDEDGVLVAAFVVRLDICAGIHELVVPVMGGHLKGGSLFKTLTPFVEHIASNLGAEYMRAHTKRTGTSKLLEQASWEKSEIVYRKRVTNGQQK